MSRARTVIVRWKSDDGEAATEPRSPIQAPIRFIGMRFSLLLPSIGSPPEVSDSRVNVTALQLSANSPGVWVSPWRDNYDASRLVLHDFLRSHEVKGDPVAVVPK